MEIADRNTLRAAEIRNSFPVLAGAPISIILDASQRLLWLMFDDHGIARHTQAGQRIIQTAEYESRLRRALLDYIEVERPPWVQNAISGRSRVIRFAGSQLVQCMVEASVAVGDGESVVQFWDSIAALARGQRDIGLLDIGRKGERCSIEFEYVRTGKKPRWISIDSNDDGYDLLSINSANDNKPLSIEVKASIIGLSGSFFLSKNEWKRASLSENHVFHLWAFDSNDRILAILNSHDLQPHIPLNNGLGNWESARIPFDAFLDSFKCPGTFARVDQL